MAHKPIHDDEIEAAFDAYLARVREPMRTLRDMIFRTADVTDGAGHLDETLKWGQPAYLTHVTKNGVTIRIDQDDTNGGDYALYVSCNSKLIDDWRERYPTLKFGGNRSVHFSVDEELPVEAVRHMIAMALTYHKTKREQKQASAS